MQAERVARPSVRENVSLIIRISITRVKHMHEGSSEDLPLRTLELLTESEKAIESNVTWRGKLC